MEHLKIKINDVQRFSEVLENSLPDFGDVEVITKDAGTVGGRGVVMITFSVELENGDIRRAQTVIGMRNFRAAATAIASTYTDDGVRVNMSDPLDDGILTNGS